MRGFATFHPFVLFLYYAMVLIITMLMLHPVILVLSLFGSLLFFLTIAPLRQFLLDLGFYFLMFLLVAITNPLFVHKGETILFFLNDDPVTLEAIVYGFVIATMLVAVIFWSKSFSEILTTDKFLYVFGKVVPKSALVLSMAFQFIPLFKRQIKKVHEAQKTLGLYTSNSITDRILGGIRVFNSILTWSLESSIHRADAMKARGYGLPKRSNFSLYKFEKRDLGMIVALFVMFFVIIFAYIKQYFAFNYYPAISDFTDTKQYFFYFLFVFMLTILPFMMEMKENLLWTFLKRKISASSIRNKKNVS